MNDWRYFLSLSIVIVGMVTLSVALVAAIAVGQALLARLEAQAAAEGCEQAVSQVFR